ncbi:RNA polymerase II subunit A C-terminal domain phosphatase isoform X3 [Rhinatrema bivittatum]|uniref:RNA polymerase II subunit A C-terminal domain phosphatase isoform X3 n=1 Tax=Rhinatrema bivittatum TaxID=194408 RepID=UPI0011290E79|nr:RNA polymerase II subunit A C-terminal domain phosphatase isoform X3 [Rhinatrema bivittatum]
MEEEEAVAVVATAARPEESGDGTLATAVNEIRCPGPRPLRLLEWKVSRGAAVQIGSVLAVCLPLVAPPESPAAAACRRREESAVPRPQRAAEKRLKSDRAGVVLELCAQPGQVIPPGLQSKNGKQQVPLSTATVSMVHSVPELMVSSEQAEQLGREDQQRLHRNRKLVLMVDLDQTLIHTTEQHCQQMSNKGIFHFQLGRGEPMLHTRLRPHCKEFLEKIAKLYELHVFTFGSRLYAHTIAGFLDPEKKLFSHRILSRDECIDPFSKTGNLRNLFPCGDSMVCIIDDREDVWKFAPNLITVKKYVYFQGTGDINAPPGSREAQIKKKVNHSKTSEALEQSAVPSVVEEQSNGFGKPKKELNGGGTVKLESSTWELNASDKVHERDSLHKADHSTETASTKDLTVTDLQTSSEQDIRIVTDKLPTKDAVANDLDFDLSSDSDTEPDAKKSSSSSSASDSENEEKRSWKKPKAVVQQATQLQDCVDISEDKNQRENSSGEDSSTISIKLLDKQAADLGVQEESEQDGLCDLGNGCTDKKEAETESQNSEQSGITVGESLDQSMEEEEEEEDTDEDDHLIYLEEILVRVHTDYFSKYDKYLKKEIQEIPDIRKIVPELKRKVLADAIIAFSGLHPTNFPVERTREHYHARALGARISKNLILNADDPDRVTHLIAARAECFFPATPNLLPADEASTVSTSSGLPYARKAFRNQLTNKCPHSDKRSGTEKVRQAQGCEHLHVVNPDWLWSCLERWEKVEEQLFPLKEDYIKTQRTTSPATFPDIHSAFQTPLFHPTPIHPKGQQGPEVRTYDPNTGKLIRKSSQNSGQSLYIQAPAPTLALPVHGEHSSFRVVQPHQEQIFDDEEITAGEDEEQAGPSRRKRQPSMSETMPLYTMCKEDLESMDKEVDDILGEGSDDSDGEKKKTEEEESEQNSRAEKLGMKIEPRIGAHSSRQRNLTGSISSCSRLLAAGEKNLLIERSGNMQTKFLVMTQLNKAYNIKKSQMYSLIVL